MATRTVTDTLYQTNGQPWPNAEIRIVRAYGSYTGSGAYPPDEVTATTDASGVYTVTLWCNEDGALAAAYHAIYPNDHDPARPERFSFSLPAGDGSPVTMSSLRASAPGIPASSLQSLLDTYTGNLPDLLQSLLIEGANITITRVGDTLVFAASGAGGSTAWADITGTPTLLSGYGITDAASAADLAAHEADTANPHSVTAVQAGADPTGTAASALAGHEASADPHPQYAQQAALGTAAAVDVADLAPATLVVGPAGYTGYADYVCTGTNDETTISAAITALGASGGVVVLARGTYNIAGAITLASNITIRGQDAGAVLVRTGSGNLFSAIGTSGGHLNNVTIEGLTITGPSTSGAMVAGNGIQIDYADHVVVRNVAISGFGALGDDGAVAIRRSTAVKVLDSRLFDSLNGAICGLSNATYPDVTGWLLRGCTLHNNWNDGAHAQQSAHIEWIGNTAYANGESGFDILGTAYVAIVGNIAYTNTHSGIEVGNTTATGSADTAITIANNICTGNTLDGIQVVGLAEYITITGNVCQANQVDGIQLAGNSAKVVQRVTMAANLLLANTRDGIRVTNDNSSHTIRGNLIADNGGRGVLVTAGTGTTADDVVIEHNRFADNATAAVGTSGSGTVSNVVQRSNVGNTGDSSVASHHITFYAPGTASAWTSMPAALTEFRGQTATRIKADLAQYRRFRVMARTTGTAGPAGAVIGVQYSTDESSWAWLDDGGSPVAGTNAAAVDAINTTSVTTWTDLATAAKGDVFLRVVGQNGNGAISPTFGIIALEVQ